MNKANITVKDLSDHPCHARFSVTVPVAEVRATVKSFAGTFSHKARIPGFRPGRTPLALIKKRFAGEIEEQVTQALLTEGTQLAIEELGLRPLMMPRLDAAPEFDENADFIFEAHCDLQPDVAVPDYRGMALERSNQDVSDEEIDALIDTFRNQRKRYETVQEPARKGDMLKVSYAAAAPAGLEIPEAAAHLISATETWLLLREPEVIPGITESLAGLAPDSSIDIEVTFPDDFRDEWLRGRSFPYRFDILEVHRETLPEVDDEFAKSIGLEGVEQLREQAATHVRIQRQREDMQVWRKQIGEFLDSKATFPLPPDMLSHETAMATMELQRQQQYRADKDDPQAPPEESAEEIKAEAARLAERRLRQRLMADAIAAKENIAVTDIEVEERIEMLRRSMRLPDYRFQDMYNVDGLKGVYRSEILTEKVIAMIIQAANLVEDPNEAVA